MNSKAGTMDAFFTGLAILLVVGSLIYAFKPKKEENKN
tara:strand:+ start:21907 stop:22020 length:114 start_codon:yes stop_codon:yes gene_type:complete